MVTHGPTLHTYKAWGVHGPSDPTGMSVLDGVWGGAPAGCGAEPREENFGPETPISPENTRKFRNHFHRSDIDRALSAALRSASRAACCWSCCLGCGCRRVLQHCSRASGPHDRQTAAGTCVHEASPRCHDALAVLHRACCASAQPSAAERRLKLTGPSGWWWLGRTIPCLF